jgi:hypothetical protein
MREPYLPVLRSRRFIRGIEIECLENDLCRLAITVRGGLLDWPRDTIHPLINKVETLTIRLDGPLTAFSAEGQRNNAPDDLGD